MAERVCSVDDCQQKYEAKGFCRRHYLCWKRTGDPIARTPIQDCSVDECTRSHYAKGWCKRHYRIAHDHGDPLWRLPTPEERFWSKVDRGGPFNCWIWKGNTRSGYGEFTIRFDSFRAHRYSYELANGPIPKHLVIDHLCRNTLCVNPDHLEPIPRGLNVLRGIGPSARAARRSACIRGHAYTSENTAITAPGHRRCRTCDRENHRQRTVA